MATKKKLLQAAAGSAGGAGPNVEELFAVHNYDGNGGSKTITNDVDLLNEGGLVWIKRRGDAGSSRLFDTERGVSSHLTSNNTDQQITNSGFGLTSFRADGFSLTDNSGGSYGVNGNVNTDAAAYYTSWTFRKASKFFDVVKYTGDRTSGNLTLNHNLKSEPGMIIIKCMDDAQSWSVYHRSEGANRGGFLNSTNAFGALTDFPSTPTSTQFTIGTDSRVNFTGREYVAYLFAHNDGDGNFGPNGDQDIIKCGTYTGGGTDENPLINLGFEPQFLLIRNASNAGYNWVMVDNARGMYGRATYFDTPVLYANLTNGETFSYRALSIKGNGFGAGQSNGHINTSGNKYIYMAIRKGNMAIPEAASEVFKTQKGVTGNGYAGTPEKQGLTLPTNSDMVVSKRFSGSGPNYLSASKTGIVNKMIDRLGQGSSASGGGGDFRRYSTDILFGDQGGYNDSGFFGTFAVWKEAKGFFDHQNYLGNFGNVQTIYHALGVVPEMIWFIPWLGTSTQHLVYHKDSHATTPQTKFVALDDAGSLGTNSNYLNGQAPTDEYFQVGNASETNQGSDQFSAMLFASVDGVSKVGSYTGNGSIQNIDCGFTSGASLVIIKNISTGYNWNMYTQANGITSGDDPWIELDNDSAIQSADRIDAFNSGFTVNNNVTVNGNGDTYIFYAVAAH